MRIHFLNSFTIAIVKKLFFRKSQLTLTLTGDIVCPLLISPFSSTWFLKNYEYKKKTRRKNVSAEAK